MFPCRLQAGGVYMTGKPGGREGGRGIESISAGETQLDPQQSQAAALSEDTAGFVTWLGLGVSVKGNVLDYSDVRDIVSQGEIIMKNTCG